jgi:hypothetical protein
MDEDARKDIEGWVGQVASLHSSTVQVRVRPQEANKAWGGDESCLQHASCYRSCVQTFFCRLSVPRKKRVN